MDDFVSYGLFDCIQVYRASTVHFTYQITSQKNQVLLGLANEAAMAHHHNEKSPAAGNSTIVLRPQVVVAGNFGARDSLIISVQGCDVTVMTCPSSFPKT